MKMKIKPIVEYIKYSYLFIMVSLFTLSSTTLFSAPQYQLKYASLAPSGSIWARYIDKMKSDIEEKSNGRVSLRIYYGGSAGDEKTMASRLKAGLIDIAAFTGIGLGEILPSARVFELPMLFDQYNEIDKTVDRLYSYYTNEFQKMGLTLGAWGEGGFVYLMTKRPVTTSADLQGMKIWAPSGDLIVKTMFQKYGLVPVYTGFESVLTQLQTGGIDAVYAPPLAAIGLQWHSEIQYITDLKLTLSTGATLINSRKLARLSEDDRQMVKEVIAFWSRELIKELRKENEKALNLLKSKNHIKSVKMSPKEIELMKKRSVEVKNELKNTMFSQEIYNHIP